MANYFRWKKGKRDEDVFYSEKPRSRSLDPRSLELSGIRLVAQYHQQQQSNQQVFLIIFMLLSTNNVCKNHNVLKINNRLGYISILVDYILITWG